ncbi:O-antigen ligase family protein [Noviherbaspirillum autotrophicum]|nr:O-antigen ligase family protein [Noviherbaspirillum autotrophicum]
MIKMTRYTSFAVFLFSAIALVVPSGFSFGPLLLVAGALVLPWHRAKLDLQKQDYALIAVLVSYFLVFVLANLIHHAPGREYDAPLRFVLAIPALLLLLAFPPRAAAFWSGLAVGAISSGLFAAWQILTGISRAEGHTNPIQYGNISLVLGVLCLAGLTWAANQPRARLWSILLVIGAGLGILGSLFTGSRGSWISLPFCLFALYKCYGGNVGKRFVVAGTIVVVSIFAMLYALPSTGVKSRVDSAVAETQEYFKSGNSNTSSGARLEMWRMGLMIAPEHPWIGWGKAGYMQRDAELIRAGAVGSITSEHSHLHNEYLDALVKRGALGLAATLAIFLIPLVLFSRRVRHANPQARPYAIGGVLLCVSYILFGLTQAFLTHNNGVMILVFMLAVLWAMSRSFDRNVSAILA